MRISVRVKPGAKEERVLRESETRFVVRVKEPPEGGRANAAVRRALADHLGVPQSRLALISGASVREKIFEIS